MASTTTSHRRNSVAPGKGGELKISVLSMSDLPTQEIPSRVSVVTSVAGWQKEENCFNCSSNNTANIHATALKDLYDASFRITVTYDKDPSLHLRTAPFPIKDLGIHRVQTLVLELERDDTRVEGAGTIQLQAELRGNYRRELQFGVRVARSWFKMIDSLERNVFRMVPTRIQNLPVIPAMMVTLFFTPFVALILSFLMPYALPVVALFFSTGATILLAFLLLYASTSRGRQRLSPLVLPAVDKVLRTTPAILYPIGPRPTPVDSLALILPQGRMGRLVLSLIIDVIGSSSYIIPIAGESSDILWAPLQTMLIIAMYNETTPKLKYLSFAEELLPGTDFIPSATIGWMAQFGPELWGLRRTTTIAEEIPNDLKLKEN